MAQDCAYREDSGLSGFIPWRKQLAFPALIKHGVTALFSPLATTDPSVDTQRPKVDET
jgi:hypothetical protein